MSDQFVIDGFIADRYSSGIGAKIRSSEATLEELVAYTESMGALELSGSGRQGTWNPLRATFYSSADSSLTQ